VVVEVEDHTVEVVEATAVDEVAMAVAVVVATAEEVVVMVEAGTTIDDLLPLETTTDEAVMSLVATLLDETTIEGTSLEGMTTDEMTDPPGETMTETGALLEGMTEKGTMIDRTELLLPKAVEDLRKYALLYG
jgi:hypothetical protein